MEQKNLYDMYDFKVGFYLPPNTIGGGNAATANLNGPTGARVKIYYCPSDRPGATQTSNTDLYWRAKGNYQVNWGHIQRPDPVYRPQSGSRAGRRSAIPTSARTARRGNPAWPSSPMERATPCFFPRPSSREGAKDHRGDLLNDGEVCAYYMTRSDSNSKSPTSCLPVTA